MRRMEIMAEIFLDDLEYDQGILSETMAIWYDLRIKNLGALREL
jgi:hypothetical protein